MNQLKYNIWLQALAIVEHWTLAPEDEQHDNRVGHDGDGTSWNKALYQIQKRFEEERDKAIREAQP